MEEIITRALVKSWLICAACVVTLCILFWSVIYIKETIEKRKWNKKIKKENAKQLKSIRKNR